MKQCTGERATQRERESNNLQKHFGGWGDKHYK